MLFGTKRFKDKMIDFLDKIVERDVVIKEWASHLKNMNSPLIMYGAGCWAQQQYKMLLEEGVSIDAVGIDTKYFKKGTFFFDKEIQPIEQLMAQNPDATLWVGFNLDQISFSDVKEKLVKRFGQREICACDCAKYDNFENQNYSYKEVAEKKNEFQWLCQRLEDQKSRDTFLSYLNQRISGNYKYAENLFDPNHYFAKDIISLNKEVFVDCGAYIGDTIQELLKLDNPKRVYAIEPDEKNFCAMQGAFCKDDRIICVNKGVYSKKDVLHFAGNNSDASKISSSGDVEIQVDSIDNIMDGEPATFIKMDIEGAELEALKGASYTIKKHHPTLAISAYHKFEDLFTLPQFIYELNPNYRFYLRRHSHLTHELVLYALA